MESLNYHNSTIIKSIIVQSNQSGQRLDRVIAEVLSQYSRSQIKHWILSRRVIVDNQVLVSPKQKMIPGSIIEIYSVNIKAINHDYSIVPQNILLDIVYEDNDILVVNKSSNMVVYPGIKNYDNTLLNALVYRYPLILKISKRAGIVQRLDKDTSGLMVVAKTCCAYNNLLQLFKNRQVIKEYDAVVFGSISHDMGIIDKPIRRHAIKRTCMTVHVGGKLAVTRYFVIERFSIYGSRVRILLETGRTHQIRVHMAYIKHPLIGDQKYGYDSNRFFLSVVKGASNKLINYLHVFNRHALHSSMLQLLHPVTQKKMRWYAPLPQDMIDLINVFKEES